MSFQASRTLLRRPQWHRIICRNASTNTQATSQASQGLTRVSDTAGNAASRAASAASGAMGTMTQMTGKAVSFAQSMFPPAMYYAKVGMELGRLVAHNRKMSPPDMATFQSYFSNMMSGMRSSTSSLQGASSTVSSTAQAMNPASMMKRMQTMDRAQMISMGVVAAEAIGFFTVGEMIGRLKLIGYSSTSHGHGAHVIEDA